MQAELLQNSMLFSGLEKDVLNALSAKMKPVKLDKNAVLMMQDEEPDGCYVINEGLLKISTMSAEGEEIVLTVLGAGEVVGEIGLIDGAPRSATATALKDTKLAFLSSAHFIIIADKTPEIYRHMLRIIAERLRTSNATLGAHQNLPVSGRLAHILLRLSEGFGEELDGGRIIIRQNFTQEDIGLMAGTARENVSRQLNQWRRENTISKISRYYCIEDADKLRDLTNI